MKNLKIFAKNIEDKAKQQIDELLEQEAFADCKVRIMPDVHAGAGCVIGFTADLGDKVIPEVVGVDIGCGMTWGKFNNKELDLKAVDEFIRANIPSGKNVREKALEQPFKITDLRCYRLLKNKHHWLEKSLGTLGGGNHFIEIDKADNGDLFLIIHSGSRNLGKQVCDIYQAKAVEYHSYSKNIEEERREIIETYKAQGKRDQIAKALHELKNKYRCATKLPRDLCYLEGQDREDYLHDMRLCQKWAWENRMHMYKQIMDAFGGGKEPQVTMHNYIGDDNIVRKGAISAKKCELVLIPMNMRDGCIVAVGKGNEDWNNSAPHGAGRIMSRSQARKELNMDEFKKSMDNIYTTSVSMETIDEAPMVYKPMQDIVDCIGDTVDIVDVIKPIYNFKAGE